MRKKRKRLKLITVFDAQMLPNEFVYKTNKKLVTT